MTKIKGANLQQEHEPHHSSSSHSNEKNHPVSQDELGLAIQALIEQLRQSGSTQTKEKSSR